MKEEARQEAGPRGAPCGAEVQMRSRTSRQRACLVCRGRGHLTLASYRPLTVSDFDCDRLLTSTEMDVRHAEYPCPACSAKISADETATLAADVQVHPEYLKDKGAMRHAQEAAAHRLVEALLDAGLVQFETTKGAEIWNPSTVTAVLGVISPKATASIEERIAERQHEVAERLVIDARNRIAIWGRDYQETHVSKHMAGVFLAEALRAVTATPHSQERAAPATSQLAKPPTRISASPDSPSRAPIKEK